MGFQTWQLTGFNLDGAVNLGGKFGLIKICKMLEYSTIPPQINYTRTNPEINLVTTNFEIITKIKKWESINKKPRIAGISSFGIGGTNVHIIISDYVPDTPHISSLNLAQKSIPDKNYEID